MSEETTGGNGHEAPLPDNETMMAAVVAIPNVGEGKVRYELRLNPAMGVRDKRAFCHTLVRMAAHAEDEMEEQMRHLSQIQVPGMSLPPDLKLPPSLTGRRGHGRG